MAITNSVTSATSVWKGTPGLLGLLGTPGYTGTGVGVVGGAIAGVVFLVRRLRRKTTTPPSA